MNVMEGMVDSRQEFLILLDLLAQEMNAVRVSSIKDPNERDRLTYAHNLANRFFQYALTMLHLCDDKNVENVPSFGNIKVGDPASIDVLTRAAMEAFLVFHYVFYSPSTADEKDYRYWTYTAGGLAERQNLPEAVFEHVEQKAEEKKRFEELCAKLRSNAVYQNLTPRLKARFVEGKELDLWRRQPDTNRRLSWRDIGIDAGLSEMLSSHMYRHLSGHAHSGSLSVIQTQQAVVRNEAEYLITPSINTLKVLAANMIHEYTELFSEAQPVLTKSGASTFVHTWIRIGQQLDENLNTSK